MTAATIAILLASSLAAGVINAMAGGGTILVFPTLVFLGMPTIAANATSTVALLPGAGSSMFAYRREVATHRAWLKTLLLPSLVGGAIGSILLLRTPEKTFAYLAPLLVLFATVLFMLREALGRWSRRGAATPEAPGETSDGRPSLGRWALAWLLQLLVAIYGGYFGAAIGILMLALLGFLGLSNIHAMNGLKNFFGMCINGVAAIYFALFGPVDWPTALVVGIGAITGGYLGARLAQSIGQKNARRAVVAIGFLVTGLLFWQRVSGK
ncbi:MAG TPA: sulfite exporter TauE/SafE family protein [Thermoanaerobaculia bacterium]